MKYLSFRSSGSKLESVISFFFANILELLLLKDGCKDIFILEILKITQILHFLLWRHVKEERIFMDFLCFFFFGEKCKHTKSALNFIQK